MCVGGGTLILLIESRVHGTNLFPLYTATRRSIRREYYVYRSLRRAFTDNKTLEKVLYYLSPLRDGKGEGCCIYIYILFFYVVVTRERLEYNGNGLTTTVFPGIPICTQACVFN